MPRPRVALVGVGAIGGTVAAVLDHASQCDLTLVARGATLAALRADGLTVRQPYAGPDAAYRCHPRVVAVDATAEAGVQDFVLCCVKAHHLPPLLEQLLPLFGPNTTLVPVINGVPYWYWYGLQGVEDRPVEVTHPP